MRNQNARNLVDQVKQDLAIKPYPVNGFMVNLDYPGLFDPYSIEAIKASPSYDNKVPVFDEFVYITTEYVSYIKALIDSGSDHPANEAGLPWTILDLSIHQTQHPSAPDLDSLQPAPLPPSSDSERE